MGSWIETRRVHRNDCVLSPKRASRKVPAGPALFTAPTVCSLGNRRHLWRCSEETSHSINRMGIEHKRVKLTSRDCRQSGIILKECALDVQLVS